MGKGRVMPVFRFAPRFLQVIVALMWVGLVALPGSAQTPYGPHGEVRLRLNRSVLAEGGASISFQQQADGLHLQLPEQPQERYAYTFRIVTAAPPAK